MRLGGCPWERFVRIGIRDPDSLLVIEMLVGANVTKVKVLENFVVVNI